MDSIKWIRKIDTGSNEYYSILVIRDDNKPLNSQILATIVRSPSGSWIVRYYFEYDINISNDEKHAPDWAKTMDEAEDKVISQIRSILKTVKQYCSNIECCIRAYRRLKNKYIEYDTDIVEGNGLTWGDLED